jgi:hypothetical protein
MNDIPESLLMPMLQKNADDLLPERENLLAELERLKMGLDELTMQSSIEQDALRKKMGKLESEAIAARLELGSSYSRQYDKSRVLEKAIRSLESKLDNEALLAYARHVFQKIHEPYIGRAISSKKAEQLEEAKSILRGWTRKAMTFAEMTNDVGQIKEILAQSE